MRRITGIIAALIVMGWIACQIDISEAITTDTRFVNTVWRRTAAGWEKVSDLSGLKFQPSAVTDVWNTHPHPAIIASLVAMLSLMALVAFNPAKRPVTPPTPARRPKSGESTAPGSNSGELELRTRAWFEQANLP